MAINSNWPKWIFASIAKHFDANRGGIPMMIEGEQRDDLDDKDSMEVRIDGPKLVETSKDHWEITTIINVLVNSAMDDTDFKRIHVNLGIVAAAFTDIQIFRYGDAGTLLGCMTLIQRSGSNEVLRISHFGQVAPNTKLLRATVEGHYRLSLDV